MSSTDSPVRVSSTTEKTTPDSATVVTKHPVQVARRNARERNRVRQVNQGFVTLRHHVPAGAKNKKLSKVETLRQAANYIQYLREMLASNGESVGAPSPYYPPQNSCYPDTSMPFPSYSPAIPVSHVSGNGYNSENFSPNPFYITGNMNGYGHFGAQEYSASPAPSYIPNPIQDYTGSQQMGIQHKISPQTGSDPSPSNSSFMSDASYEMTLSPQEIKYSNSQNFAQYAQIGN